VIDYTAALMNQSAIQGRNPTYTVGPVDGATWEEALNALVGGLEGHRGIHDEITAGSGRIGD